MRIDVPLGPERFEVGQLDRTTDQGLWRFSASHDGYSVEVLLAGSSDGPDSAWLDLAARVVPQLGPLVAVSRYYLRAFVDERKLDGPGEWELDWLEFGRHPDDMPEPFELVLVHGGDGYGGWGGAVLPRAERVAALRVPAVPAVAQGKPNQVACCQRVFLETQSGSNGARFRSTP